MVYKHILFCTDFSDDAHMAFTHALDLNRKYKARLYLLHVIPPSDPCGTPPDATPGDSTGNYPGLSHDRSHDRSGRATSDEGDVRLQQQALKAMIKQYVHEFDDQDDYDIQVRIGSPDIEIIRFAREFHIDMILLGVQGRPEKDRRLFIRTAANVSKFAPCQVITIRSPRERGNDIETTL